MPSDNKIVSISILNYLLGWWHSYPPPPFWGGQIYNSGEWERERERDEKIQAQKIEWQKIERQKNISGGKGEKIAHFISDDASEFLGWKKPDIKGLTNQL